MEINEINKILKRAKSKTKAREQKKVVKWVPIFKTHLYNSEQDVKRQFEYHDDYIKAIQVEI